MKVGDKIVIDGEEAEVIHIAHSINEECDHDWATNEDEEPTHCRTCGVSFIRYIFCSEF